MKNCALILILSILTFNLLGQSPGKIKRAADKLFEIQEYKEALSKYEQIKEKLVKDVDLKYKIGVCYFYTNNTEQCILYLNFYSKNAPSPKSMTNYYMARAHHFQNEFRKAAFYYKNYLKSLSSDDPKRKEFKRFIIQCTNGPKVAEINSRAIVSTLGEQINSPYDDFRACFNPQVENTLFFSSNRKGSTGGKLNKKNKSDEENNYYHSDIYKSKLVLGNWLEAEGLSSRYNTEMSEEIISFFDKGYQMVFLKSYSDGHKEVVKDNFDSDSIEVVLPFAIKASSNHWDGDHFFASDSIIIFSSNRPGGYGGKDLYYSTLSKEEGWRQAINLGPFINGQYNEISPFLAKDGRSLYFSSNNPQSMGGYDIYKAVFEDASRDWTPAKNLGCPINSAAHDKDFVLSKDGLKAYFCSKRMEGFGGYDLYSAYFRSYLPEQLLGKEPKTFVDVLTNVTSLTQNDPSNQSLNKVTPLEALEGKTSASNQIIYNIAPIYYNAENGNIEGSRNTILTLTKLLTRHPESIVVLSGHSDNKSDETNDLFLTIKQAEKIAQELLKNGAKNKQIWIRGCGQNYPIANNHNFDGTPNLIGSTMNRRINIDLYNIKHLADKISVRIIAPKVSSVMVNAAHQRYQKKIKGLTYKIQLTETASLYSHSIFAELQYPSTEKRPNDTKVKYMIGLESSFTAIKIILAKAIAEGFEKAQIIPYVNGIRITEDDAQLLFSQYEDLRNYLDFQSN